MTHLELHVVPERPDHLHDLLRQLTGGGEHERLAVRHRGVDLLQDRHREGGGLTGTWWSEA